MRVIWYVLSCVIVAYVFQTIALAAGLSWNLATAIGVAVMLFWIALYVGSGRRGNDEVTK